MVLVLPRRVEPHTLPVEPVAAVVAPDHRPDVIIQRLAQAVRLTRLRQNLQLCLSINRQWCQLLSMRPSRRDSRRNLWVAHICDRRTPRAPHGVSCRCCCHCLCAAGVQALTPGKRLQLVCQRSRPADPPFGECCSLRAVREQLLLLPCRAGRCGCCCCRCL